MTMEKLSPIFEEILKERVSQNEVFGEQNCPMVGRENILQKFPYPRKEALEKQLKNSRDRINRGVYGWFDILLEEICEAFLEKKAKTATRRNDTGCRCSHCNN